VTVHEALKCAEQYAAMLGYLTDVRCEPFAAPSEAALAGLVDACQQVERHVRLVRQVLPARALKLRISGSQRP
jgi:hypothetical protein